MVHRFLPRIQIRVLETRAHIVRRKKHQWGHRGCSVTCNTRQCFVKPILLTSRHLTYHVTLGSLGHHRWFHNQFPPFFLVIHCPLGFGKLQACLFPDVVFPSLPLSALSSSPFHCALQDGFGQTWWPGDMFIPLQFASLYDSQEIFVWSDCLLNLGTDFLVSKMVFANVH